MAFKLKKQSETFPYLVEFNEVDGSGKKLTHRIKFDFLRMKRSEMDALWEEKEATKPEAENSDQEKTIRERYLEALENDVDWVMKFVRGWHDVEIDGSTEFNRDNLRTLMDSYGSLAVALFGAFTEGNIGGIRKN